MPFLNFEDYKTLIKDDVLQAVMDNDKTIVLEVEQMAQSEIESYLNQRYDVANIFNKTANNRNPLILMYMIDIVLYHIHARINPKFIPDIRKDRYDVAISWLIKVARGELNPDLPKIDNSETSLAGLGNRWGSNTKFNHQF
jgi:phage gp36-like protein